MGGRRPSRQSEALDRLEAPGVPGRAQPAGATWTSRVCSGSWSAGRSPVTTWPTRPMAWSSRSTDSTSSVDWAWSAGPLAGPSPTSSRRSRSRRWSRTSCPTSGRTGSLTPVAHLTPVKVAGSTVVTRDAPQPRRGASQGHPHRRPRGAPQGRRRHPGGGPAHRGTAHRCRARVPDAGRVPGVRHRAWSRTRARSATTAPTPRVRRGSARSIGHFAGRGGMDIEGAGWVVLSQLLERGMIHSRGDFYRLTVEELETLDRFARKSAENLKAAIERSRVRPAGADHQCPGHPPGR